MKNLMILSLVFGLFSVNALALDVPRSNKEIVIFSHSTDFKLQVAKSSLNKAELTNGGTKQTVDCEPNLHTIHDLFRK